MPKSPLPFDPIEEARRQWASHGWSESAEGMAAVTSVMRAHQIVLSRVDEQLRDVGLTFARYEVLMLLYFSRAGALPLVVIGSRLQVHPTSITSAVDRLEHQGLVHRRPHPTDRRTKLAKLTESGEEVALEATSRLNESVFADPGLSRAQTRKLVELLKVLRGRAGDF